MDEIDTTVPARPWPIITAWVYSGGKAPAKPNTPPESRAVQVPTTDRHAIVKMKREVGETDETKIDNEVRMKRPTYTTRGAVTIFRDVITQRMSVQTSKKLKVTEK